MLIISACKKLYWFKGQKIDHFISIMPEFEKLTYMQEYAGEPWHDACT